MELNGFARALIAPEDDNAKLKSVDEFKNMDDTRHKASFKQIYKLLKVLLKVISQV